MSTATETTRDPIVAHRASNRPAGYVDAHCINCGAGLFVPPTEAPHCDKCSPETPQFVHDSGCCAFLGRTNHNNTDYDLYFCNKEIPKETVICRYGNDGSAYTSGIAFGKKGVEPYATALRMAHARGLTTSTPDAPPAPEQQSAEEQRGLAYVQRKLGKVSMVEFVQTRRYLHFSSGNGGKGTTTYHEEWGCIINVAYGATFHVANGPTATAAAEAACAKVLEERARLAEEAEHEQADQEIGERFDGLS